MLVRAKRLISPGNLVAADEKLLAGLNQNFTWDRLFKPDHMVKLCQKLAVFVMA
jgi:hypothetical protein